jgi:inner membrane protein
MLAGRCFQRREKSGATPRARNLSASMVLFCWLSVLPDIDVAAFRLGIAYSDPLGHRGATHSLLFALAIGVAAAALAYRRFEAGFARLALFCFVVIATHPLLDALTDGGLGVELFWPLSTRRFFAPFRFIPVAPIGARFLSTAGLSVALTELVYFAPVFAIALWPRSK